MKRTKTQISHLLHTELIHKAKEKRDNEYKKLATFTLSQIKSATTSSLKEISSKIPITDPIVCFNHATLVYTLIKLRNDHHESLLRVLENLIPENDPEVEIFLSYVYSKLMKHLNRGVIHNKLTDCIYKLAGSESSLPSAYFLLFISQHSPSSILFCTNQFIKAVKRALFHRSNEINNVGYESLRVFLQYLVRIQTPQIQYTVSMLFHSASRKYNRDHYCIHGAFLIFSALFEISPNMITSDLESLIRKLINTNNRYSVELKSIVYHILILLWIFDRRLLETRVFDQVKSMMFSDVCSVNAKPFSSLALLRLIQNDPSQISVHERDLISAIQNIFNTQQDSIMKNGFMILLEISKSKKDLISRYEKQIATALNDVPVNDDFVSTVPSLLTQFPSLWHEFKPIFLDRIQQNPDILQSTSFLKFLVKCPPMESAIVTNQLIYLCDSNSWHVRAFVPEALIAQIDFSQPNPNRIPINRLLTLALSDPIPYVRERVLSSFSSTSFKFLSNPQILNSLASLVKDENSQVRNSCIILIGRIAQYNPFDALPILRSVLLDALFILDSPKAPRIKEEMSFSFSELLTATYDILPVYCPTLCDIALRQLSFTPTCELTYFEQRSIENINLNLTQSIGLIAQNNVQLIGPHIFQFSNFFIWMLQQHGPKQLKLAVVRTLYTILTRAGSVPGVDLTRMYNALTSIASKWNSRKLNIAVLKLMGFIGAIDQQTGLSDELALEGNKIPHYKEDYFMACACKTLLSVFSDDSLIVHHHLAMKALVKIFCADLSNGIEYFNEFMTVFLEKIRKGNPIDYIVVLKQICAEAPSHWVTHFATDLLELIQKLWETTIKSLLMDIIDLIPVLANVLVDRFTPHLPNCTSFLLNCLYSNSGTDSEVSSKALFSMIALRSISQDYLFLIVPEIVSVISSSTTSSVVRSQTLDGLRVLIQNCDCSTFASSLIRCSLRCISSENKNVKESALQVIYSIMVSFGKSQFSFFSEQVKNILNQNGIPLDNFKAIYNNSKSEPFLSDFPFITTDDPSIYLKSIKSSINKTRFDEERFVSAFSFIEDETPWNRKEWYHHLVSTTLDCSPSHFLRSCAFLSDTLFHISEALFNAAFLSCWNQMSTDGQRQVSGCLTVACLSDPLPGSIRSSLVRLFEFMEQSEVKLEIEESVLMKTCEDSSQYAKALYFAHRCFYKDRFDLKTIENLIRLSSHLGLTKAVQGLSLQVLDMEMQPLWCEQLGQWEMAKKYYLENNDPKLSGESYKGILRCLKHQQKWDEIIAKMECFDDQTPVIKSEISPIIATALFHRKQWDKLPSILEFCPLNSVSVLMIAALYEINNNKSDEAIKTIEKAFDILARNARAVFKHDKAALYPLLVKAQQLHEISEIASCNKDLSSVWESRLKLCRESFDVFHRILSVRLTYMDVKQMMKPAIKMLKLALKQKDIAVFESSFQFLFPEPDKWPIEVVFLNIQGKWTQGMTNEAINELKSVLSIKKTNNGKVFSRMYYTCGTWMLQNCHPNQMGAFINDAIPFLENSIASDRTYYNAWHRWSWACSAMYYAAPSVVKHAVNAINGFFECVKLRQGNSFSDLIQMISLVFTAKLNQESFSRVTKRISQLSDSVLLMVIPQLFAQLGRAKDPLLHFVSDLIKRLLPNHYHVLLFPLLFFSYTSLGPTSFGLEETIDTCPNPSAAELLQQFSSENSIAATEAKIISDGLILCSSSRIEAWLDSICLAIRAMSKRDSTTALAIIESALLIPPQPGDTQFTNDFFVELQKYYKTISSSDPSDAASILSSLHNTHRMLKSYLSSFRQVKMYLTAPNLAQLRNSCLAVPGTYNSNTNLVSIQQFDPTLDVYYSKQRPRILIIYGSDGTQHRSLLKGREDLRLDQRVMQFFDLINQHIGRDFPSESRNLRIFRYSITPISKTAGLIQFVNGADTMFSLISDYRRERSQEVFYESKMMEKVISKSIDSLMPIQRYEVLTETLKSTPDNDLREIMWLKSPCSREWVSRVSHFAQSSAIMSIIGYILGLGDRHPSNLMLHRFTGSVIHIDFSDCFEISRDRIRFPELIPFRLTRMIRCAFGPTNIEGDFRITCHETVRLIRSHRESIMAVLDIFLQEPLDAVDEINPSQSTPELEIMRGIEEVGKEVFINDDEIWSFEEIDNVMRTSIRDSMNRINNKIVGRDFKKKSEVTIEQQVEKLIDNATDMYLMSHLYHGWTPLW